MKHGKGATTMNDIRTFCEGILVPLALALFGGTARACRFGVKSWRHFCGSIVVSGFAGVVVHLLIADLGMSEATKAACVAISGYSGGMMLDLLSSRLKRGVELYPGFGSGGEPGRNPERNGGRDEGRDDGRNGGRDDAPSPPWDGEERRKGAGKGVHNGEETEKEHTVWP